MRRALIAAITAVATGGIAVAQDPAPKPDPNAEHPPTNRMDQTLPEMKAPAEAEHAPANRVDQAVPPMKPGDPQSAETGTTSGSGNLAASDEWIGRAVYSSDGKNLGEVAKLSGTDILVDIGGFLGIGATRALIKSDQIKEVQSDRIVVTHNNNRAGKRRPSAPAVRRGLFVQTSGYGAAPVRAPPPDVTSAPENISRLAGKPIASSHVLRADGGSCIRFC
jgi:hypothetical protein